jgi:hypothetical protein
VLFALACPASIVLRRACHLRSSIYQNPSNGGKHPQEVTA